MAALTIAYPRPSSVGIVYDGDRKVGLLFPADGRDDALLMAHPERHTGLDTVDDVPAPIGSRPLHYPTTAEALAALGNPEVRP